MRPCKWERIFYDSAPVPFGIGNCSMPSYDCVYAGVVDISDVSECGETCPAFEEAPPEPVEDWEIAK